MRCAAALRLVLACAPTLAAGPPFPSRPIRFIVPNTTACGITDLMAHSVASR